MVEELSAYGLNSDSLCYICSYLKDRKQCVQIKTEQSEFDTIGETIGETIPRPLSRKSKLSNLWIHGVKFFSEIKLQTTCFNLIKSFLKK